MLLLFILAIFFCASFLIYMYLRSMKTLLFNPPKRRMLFYILSLTWGLPTVIIGAFAALLVRMKGYRPRKYGWEWCFEIPNINWGLSLGLFFIAPAGNEKIKIHELGHGIQNMYLGPFFPLAVSIPSVIRFWYHKGRTKRKKACKEYDAAWFEGSATRSGYALISRLKNVTSSN